MEKKLLLILLLLAVMPVAMFGQSEQNENSATTETKNQYLTNGFWDNWFISGGIGGQVYFGETDSKGDFGKRLTPAFDIAVGKWFTPGLGLRLQYNGASLKGFSYGNGLYLSSKPNKDGLYSQKWDYMNLHGDVLFNLSSMLCGYNENRLYEAIPYVGFGFVHAFEDGHNNSFAANVGLINKFRVSKALDINLEVRGTLVNQDFDGQVGGVYGEGILGATVGVTYKFKTRGFNKPTPKIVSTGISAAEMQSITDKLREQEAYSKRLENELNDAKNKNAQAPDQKEVASAPRTVFFNINEAVISAKDKVNIKYAADQIKQNPNKKYVINGYADKATGTPAYNLKLSQKRAQAVYDALVKEHNVNANQLSVQGMGGVDNMFDGNSLNRVVIVE